MGEPQIYASRLNDASTPATTPALDNFLDADLGIYNLNFDDMDDECKADQIVTLLDSLPSLREMRDYLMKQSRVEEPNLRAWTERITPAALGLLRWIVASNRSCIVQVDKCPGQEDLEVTAAKIRLDQRMSNIDASWVQFRFAQGAPDKERKFLSALKENQDKLNAAFPTLFAWHGSALSNWHSIIRSGLDFKETLNGRAFGHGVYHAIDQTVSLGYAGTRPVSNGIYIHKRIQLLAVRLILNTVFMARIHFANYVCHESQRNYQRSFSLSKLPTTPSGTAHRLDSMQILTCTNSNRCCRASLAASQYLSSP